MLLELDGVSRHYDVGGGTVTALADVDLAVDTGELVVVLGPSGSGKTTLLNLIGGLDVASEGDITVGGVRLGSANRARALPLPPRDRQLRVPDLQPLPRPDRVGERAVRTATSPAGGGRRPARYSTRVGLADRLEHFPGQLSGGEQQRVAIARALATGNPVLLADEPTGELDFRTGTQILGLLREQVAAGVTVVIVTHNREIGRMADRVVELSGGRVVGDAPPTGGTVSVDELRW